MKKVTRNTQVRQEQAVRSIRQAANTITATTLRRAIWEDSGADIDVLVDRFARNHTATGYRDPKIQKRAVDAAADAVLKRTDDATQRAIAAVLDRWYSRYLLAADVGFELGFATANTLRR